MKSQREELLEGDILKLMFKLSVPAILAMFVIGLYSFVDAIFVGKWVGERALGAISVAYPFTLINNGCAVLVGIGSASVLSRAIGKNDKNTINKIMGNLLLMVLGISLVITILGFLFANKLLMLTGVEGEILTLATRYLKIIYLGSFFVNFAQSANMVMRGEGIMKKAMSIMAAGAVLNIILDPIFIKVLGYGIDGAAIATVISQIVQAMLTIYYFVFESKRVRFNKIALEPDLIKPILSVGVSAMIMQVMSLVQQTVMYNTLSKYGGENQIVLMGATMRYLMLSFIPIWGVSQSFQPVVGTNYGAKKYERVKKATKIFTAGSTFLAMLFWIPFVFNTKKVLSLFIKDISIIESGFKNPLIMYSVFPLMGFVIMSITLFQALGKGKNAGILTMLRQLVLFVPVTIILPKFIGVKGVWLGIPITDAIVCLIGVVLVIKEFKEHEALKQLKDTRSCA